MKALLVIDVQKGIVSFGDFGTQLTYMEHIIQDFKQMDLPVIFMQHVDDMEESPLFKGSKGAELYPPFSGYPDYVLEKKTPSSFYATELGSLLESLDITQLFIIGFNTEFCCLFTAISAFDRGYEVTFIDNATGTVNDENTYEMEGLDIPDFVGTILHWSDAIEVLDYEEYVEEYNLGDRD